MLGSKKRDYVTGNRLVRATLFVHNERMKELISKGYEKLEASNIAYTEVQSGELGDSIEREIKSLKKRKLS